MIIILPSAKVNDVEYNTTARIKWAIISLLFITNSKAHFSFSLHSENSIYFAHCSIFTCFLKNLFSCGRFPAYRSILRTFTHFTFRPNCILYGAYYRIRLITVLQEYISKTTIACTWFSITHSTACIVVQVRCFRFSQEKTITCPSNA